MHIVNAIFKIEVLIRDTKRDEADAQAGLLKIWNDGAVGMIGSSSSNPTSAMATIAGIDNINLAIVGFHAGSPTLSNMKKYPTFLRVNPIITDVIRAIMSLLKRTFCAFQPASVLTSLTYYSLSLLIFLSKSNVNLQFTTLGKISSVRMLSDFHWGCANYVYTPLDLFSTSAYEYFKSHAPSKKTKIRLASSISLKPSPTPDDYTEAAKKIMKSNCLITIIVTQTVPTGEIVREAYKQGYKGEIVIQGASMSIQGYLRSKVATVLDDHSEANRMMRGIIAVSPSNGFGTSKFVCW